MRLKNADRDALLVELHEKYSSLVWYARSQPENYSVAEKGLKTVEFLYSKEVDELKSESSDWHHGFNSGVLAAARLIMTAIDEGPDAARDRFPELDT